MIFHCFMDSQEKIAKEIAKKAEMRSNRPDDPTNPLRQKEYLKHRYRVQTAKAIVDSTSPFAPKSLYKNTSYNRRLLNFARIERENTIMLQHLANIIHGKVCNSKLYTFKTVQQKYTES